MTPTLTEDFALVPLSAIETTNGLQVVFKWAISGLEVPESGQMNETLIEHNQAEL